MTIAHRTVILSSLTVAALLLASPAARTADAEPAPDSWDWRATIYLWLPGIDGETSFPPDGGGPDFGVSGDAFFDTLNSVFMGAFEGRRGPWGAMTDVVYLDLGANKKATRDFDIGQVELPAGVDADLGLDISGWVWTLTGSYEVMRLDGFSINVLAGARMLELQEDLRWSLNGDIASLPLPGRSGSSHLEDTMWDAIVGVKGRASFGAERNWYVPYYLDVGAGNSDLTWQGLVGLGYSFDSWDLIAAWRHLDYDFGNNTPIKSIAFDGPALGITFKF